MAYVHAFWVGGLICAAVQILMDRTKLMPGRIMVLLVCGGAVLGFLNIYGPFQKFAGALIFGYLASHIFEPKMKK